ncbi:hypothetical protein D3C71_1859040 [compost metagenome]
MKLFRLLRQQLVGLLDLLHAPMLQMEIAGNQAEQNAEDRPCRQGVRHNLGHVLISGDNAEYANVDCIQNIDTQNNDQALYRQGSRRTAEPRGSSGADKPNNG